MARTNIQVVITVKDGASKPLDNVQKGIRKTGKAAKDSASDIWQFNKTLFSTFAFVGLFTKGFSKLKESLMIGAELDKLSTQFERQVGPKSKFIQALEGSTNVVLDEMTALESGLQLSNLGITHGLENTADTIAKFAVAGRMAGKDSTDVIRGLTSAVTEGNVARLEELGIMKRSDPAFMALQAITAKAGGTMGGVIAKQQAMAIVMGAINKRVQGQMFAFMSLGEVIDYTGKAYNNLRRNIGILLGNAVRPLLEKLLPLIQHFNKIVENISRADKHTLFLVKTILALTGALSGLFAALGTMKLVVKLLGFTPFGFGGMATAILAVTAAFVGLSREAQGPLEKLKLFGAIFKGIYELVTNLDPETGMSKISKSTRDLLEKYGLLGFVKTISRIVAIIKTVLQDIYTAFNRVAVQVDNIFGGMFGQFKDIFASFTSTWTTWWTSNAVSDIEKFGRAATVILTGVLAIFGVKKLAGMFSGAMSKIPIIGGMFGGGKNPRGTAGDPVHVKPVGGLGGVGIGGAAAGVGIFATLWSAIKLVTQGLGKDGLVRTIKNFPIYFELFFKQAFPRAASVLFRSFGFVARLFTGISGIARVVISSLGSLATRALAFLGPWGLVIAGAIALAAFFKSQAFQDMLSWADKKTGGMLSGVDPKYQQQVDKFNAPGGDIQMQYEQAKKMGWDRGRSLEEYQNDVNNKNGQTGKQTSISVPTVGGDEEATIQALGDQMKNMDDASREKMQASIESALRSDSAGGSLIAPEEFANFQRLLTAAFDESKNLQELVNQTKVKQAALRSNQRG